MTEIYLHIVARMTDYMATHPYLRSADGGSPPASASTSTLQPLARDGVELVVGPGESACLIMHSDAADLQWSCEHERSISFDFLQSEAASRG